MPKKAAGGSFSSAIKHLFRHLHDPAMLRKNPLVQRFFEEPANERAGYVTDRARLDRIHQLVRQAAERCRDDDLISGEFGESTPTICHRDMAVLGAAAHSIGGAKARHIDYTLLPPAGRDLPAHRSLYFRP